MRYYLILILSILGFTYWISSRDTEQPFPVAPGNVGEQIREARASAGVSEDELAEVLGLSPQHIRTIEAGLAVPTRDIVVEIEQVLGVEIVLDNI